MKTVRPSKCFPDDSKMIPGIRLMVLWEGAKNNGGKTDGYMKLNEKQAEIKMHAHTRAHMCK